MNQRLIDRIVRHVPWTPGTADPTPLVEREWLVTNGLGGYSSGTVSGVTTRRYHGLLVAALPNPLGRQVMLASLNERVLLASGEEVALGGEEPDAEGLTVPGAARLQSFSLEAGLPVWRYAIDGGVLVRRVMMPHQQNTVHVSWALEGGSQDVTLALDPVFHFRGYEDAVDTAVEEYEVQHEEGGWIVRSPGGRPPVRLALYGNPGEMKGAARRIAARHYRVEQRRGYAHAGEAWTPGALTVPIAPGSEVTLVASTESLDVMRTLTPQEARWAEHERRRRLLAKAVRRCPAIAEDVIAAELVLAADQFIIVPASRHVDMARARAVGDEIRSVIAGYHWFTDWGRDTMISLEGLTLSTGRWREAGFILRTFAHYVRDGLLPNMFPDGSSEGLYHTADATLWFFHAVDRFVAITRDEHTLDELFPVLRSIVDHHLRGTRFGIGVDPADGLLTQGEEGYQLTWMDAKVDGWVVTPRRGKAVELNALWYNALCLMEGWLRRRGDDAGAREVALHASRARESFNARFWYDAGGYLYDVVDGPAGDSIECRPNQVLAVSLPNPVLATERWDAVLRTVRDRLLTPVGLRSLAPGSPDYAARYDGDLRARDAAYHQGTVWAWLIGPWIDAWLRAHPGDRAGARAMLDGLEVAMDGFGVGSIAEIFDAEPPYTPRGCIAQAWSVAEALRCRLRTAEAAHRHGERPRATRLPYGGSTRATAGAALGAAGAVWHEDDDVEGPAHPHRGDTTMPLNSLQDLYLEQLKDLYSAETQISKNLPAMIEAAKHPELRAGFEKHLKQTQEQIRRLEQVGQSLGESLEGHECKAMKGIIEEAKETLKEGADSDVLDAALIADAQRVEHYEIAGYGCVRTYARMLGRDEDVRLLQQTLDEEAQTDEILTQLAEKVINVDALKGDREVGLQASREGGTAAKSAGSEAGMRRDLGNEAR